MYVNQAGNMMTDPIADMLTRIRNAYMARKRELTMPTSKLKKHLADLLVREGYLAGASVEEQKPVSALKLELKYDGKRAAIQEIKRESKPGHRKYTSSVEMPKILNGYGIAIISTSKGLMTNKEAKNAGVGGEIICSVY